MASKTNEVSITVRPLEIQAIKLRIVGDTPLIMHAWSEKAKRMMLEAQQGRVKGKKKEARNPVEDFINSMYWLTPKPTEMTMEAFDEAVSNGARFGFPATAIKMAANSAAYRAGWTKNQMGLRGAYFIEGDENGLVEIESDSPIMREDMVRVGMGTADLRYRGEFRNWSAELTISYNANCDISLDNIFSALELGGYSCGIGENRPEKDGIFGRFHIQKD